MKRIVNILLEEKISESPGHSQGAVDAVKLDPASTTLKTEITTTLINTL